MLLIELNDPAVTKLNKQSFIQNIQANHTLAHSIFKIYKTELWFFKTFSAGFKYIKWSILFVKHAITESYY